MGLFFIPVFAVHGAASRLSCVFLGIRLHTFSTSPPQYELVCMEVYDFDPVLVHLRRFVTFLALSHQPCRGTWCSALRVKVSPVFRQCNLLFSQLVGLWTHIKSSCTWEWCCKKPSKRNHVNRGKPEGLFETKRFR